MYIPDGVNEPLCGTCLRILTARGRPPWQPDAIARKANLLVMVFRSAHAQGFSSDVCENISEFLVPWWKA